MSKGLFRLIGAAGGVMLAVTLAHGRLEAQPAETLPFFLSNQAFDSHGVENINIFNGDTGISVPIGPSYPLGPTGFQYQLAIHNSLKFWHFSAATCPSGGDRQFAWIAGDPTIGVGWTLSPGYVVKRLPAGVWEYRDPSGGVHQVDLVAANPAVTDDGGYLRIKAFPAPGNATSYTVEFPDGTIHTFDHQYNPPAASPASVDFRNVNYGESAQSRFGLGDIKDRFGNTLVTVNWSGTNPSEISSISLATLGSSISFTWANHAAGSFTWRVLDYVTFPAPGSKQLRVDFSYLAGGATFARNAFDTSAGSGCTVSPANVSVPQLTTVTFLDPGATPSILHPRMLSPTSPPPLPRRFAPPFKCSSKGRSTRCGWPLTG
jgi:hypothetical protein